MLEKLVNRFKNVGRSLVISSALVGSGCAQWLETVHPSNIAPVHPIFYLDRSNLNKDLNHLTDNELIEHIQSFYQVNDYFKKRFKYQFDKEGIIFEGFFNFGKDKGESFSENRKKGYGVCIDYAIMSAAEMVDNGYPPYILLMVDNPYVGKERHAVHIYRDNRGFFGCSINTPLDPKFNSVDSLVYSLGLVTGISFKYYKIIDLSSQGETDWIYGPYDVYPKIPFGKWKETKRPLRLSHMETDYINMILKNK